MRSQDRVEPRNTYESIQHLDLDLAYELCSSDLEVWLASKTHGNYHGCDPLVFIYVTCA